MIKIGKVIGDVIEAGGVKNVTNNYYSEAPQTDGDKTGDIICNTECDVPEQLKSGEAEDLMEDLVDAGILTENWQPKGLSGSERGMVARAVCERLKVEEVWQVFGLLWNEKPETLRSYFNKALEQKKTLLFQEKLKKIIY